MKCSAENIDKKMPLCYTCVEIQVGGKGVKGFYRAKLISAKRSSREDGVDTARAVQQVKAA